MQRLYDEAAATAIRPERELCPVKVVVWDLDNTIWDGILLENDQVELRPGMRDVLEKLDRCGILHSIASRNEPDSAMRRLQQLGIEELFLCPQIGWGAKSHAVACIAQRLNLGLDSFLFVDDEPFEREEVCSALPQVRTLDAAETATMLMRPDLQPRFVSASDRRRLYQADFIRQQAEETFQGPAAEFLRSLGMRLTIAPCHQDDLMRAEELTVRTNQLNTTGYTYSYEELDDFSRSPDHQLLLARLEDRFGSYGTIGLALVEKSSPRCWTVKLLLMSCRVMSRGVGSVLLAHLIGCAHAAGVKLQAEFRPNGRNRMMEIAYRFVGFREVQSGSEMMLFEHAAEALPAFPDYMDIVIEGSTTPSLPPAIT